MALTKDHHQVLGLLAVRGPVSSSDIQDALDKSQPTVSRLLAGLPSQVLTLGRGRATRYALPKSIHNLSPQQPIWWTSETGSLEQVGTLSLLWRDLVHVDADFGESLTEAALPWFLAPLKAEGFLGRLLARRLSGAGLGEDPGRWDIGSSLFAALHLHDATGALTLGEPVRKHVHPPLPAAQARLAAALDAMADDVGKHLPAGSSAGGEQPKFMALIEDGRHVLVKFSPPRRTPFGERWSDLLQAEHLAGQVLGEHGIAAARASVLVGAKRTYLLSERYDRVGAHGRRHVVPVGEVHKAFVPGSYNHWGATCEALARQRRLSGDDARLASLALQFGRLIGNTDMHQGNLSFLVSRDGLAKGRFDLAPVYDMLPMRWRPDAALGGAPDYSPFEPDALSIGGPAAAPAHAFWERLSQHAGVSKGLRQAAKEMASRIQAASPATPSSSDAPVSGAAPRTRRRP